MSDDETETGVVGRVRAIAASVGDQVAEAVTKLSDERLHALTAELEDGKRSADYVSLALVSAAILGYHRGRRSVYLYLYLRCQYKLATALHKKLLDEQTRRHKQKISDLLVEAAGRRSRPAAFSGATT